MTSLEKSISVVSHVGKGLHNILEANDGKKMPVIFDLKHQVPSDDKVGALFSSEIGNIVRTSAPVCHLGWKKVSTDDKGKMRDSLTVLFEVDLSHPTSTSSAPAHVQTSTSSRGSNGVHSDADY